MNNLLLKAVMGLVCAMACGCGGGSILKRSKLSYEQTINRLQSGAINPDLSGRARLPADLQAASVDGEIYVSHPSTNQIVVVFKTWRGKGNNMEGLLYANPPLGESATQTDYYGKQAISVGPVALTLEKQIDSNWHKVSYKLD